MTGRDLGMSYQSRAQLAQRLNQLPRIQFNELLFVLSAPEGLIPPSTAAQGDRTLALLSWVTSDAGPGLATLQHLLNAMAGAPAAAAAGHCPYKGLSYFDCNGEDYKYFYGREALTQDLLHRVDHSPFTAIVGSSGSGKSSVLRAGLLQRLQDPHHEIRILVPGDQPLQNLALAFVDQSQSQIVRATQQQQAEILLEQGADGLRRLIQNSDAQRVFLVIDQFEEAFTLCQDAPARQRFFETLLGAVAAIPQKLRLIVAMRSDFVGRCFDQPYGGLADQVQQHLVAVLPMARSDLTAAITGPAFSVGIDLEPELIHQLLNDVEQSPGSLPLLQYTLQELWQQRQGNTLELKTYVQLGGVTGTLQQRADAVYAALSADQQQTARHIFLNLTQPGDGAEDTRRRVLQSSLETDQHPAATVATTVQKLAAANLIITSEVIGPDGSREAVVDVAHEALIRHWDQLRSWLTSNRVALEQQRRIEGSAQEWQQHHQSRDYLLRGARLAEAKQYQRDHGRTLGLSKPAAVFVQRSQRQQGSRSLAAVCLISGLSSLAVFTGQQVSERQFQTQYSSVLVGGETRADLLPVLPKALQIAHRHAHRGNVATAVENYKKVLTAAHQFAAAAHTGPGFQASDRQRIQAVIEAAEQGLAEIMAQRYWPTLEQDLANQNYGDIKPEAPITAYEDQYTAGALKTTYSILMGRSGLNADTNANGLLDPVEKNLIPCATLEALEQTWRRLTNGQCGFQENGDYYYSQTCTPLANNTLTERIFPRPLESAIERIEACQID